MIRLTHEQAEFVSVYLLNEHPREHERDEAAKIASEIERQLAEITDLNEPIFKTQEEVDHFKVSMARMNRTYWKHLMMEKRKNETEDQCALRIIKSTCSCFGNAGFRHSDCPIHGHEWRKSEEYPPITPPEAA